MYLFDIELTVVTIQQMIYIFDRDLAKQSNGIQLYGSLGREIRKKTRTSGPFFTSFCTKNGHKLSPGLLRNYTIMRSVGIARQSSDSH